MPPRRCTIGVCRGCGAEKDIERHVWWRPTCAVAYRSESSLAGSAADEGDGPVAPTSSAAAETAFTLERRRQMLVALTRWTVNAMVSDKWKGQIKSDINSVISFALAEVEQQLCGALDHQTCAELMPGVRDAFDLFNGIANPRAENNELQAMMPCLRTYERKMGSGKEDIAYTTVLADWLQLKMNYDPRRAIESS